jgi:hypothetical protein
VLRVLYLVYAARHAGRVDRGRADRLNKALRVRQQAGDRLERLRAKLTSKEASHEPRRAS